MLGTDDVAEILIVRSLWLHELGGILNVRVDVYQLAHLAADGIVKVQKQLPAPLREEGPQVVLVILEEGRLAVGRLYSLPVLPPPVAVVGKSY